MNGQLISYINKRKADITWLATFAAAAMGAMIPVSVALTGILAAMAVFFGLISGVYARHWRSVLANPIALTALLMFAWLTLTLTYTEAPLGEALRLLKKYRELLLIPLLLPLFFQPAARRWGMRAFLATMLMTLAVCYADGLWQVIRTGGIQVELDVFKSRITQGVFLAFAGFWVALRLFDDPPRRRLWAVLLGIIAFYVFFMIGGRTGQVIFLALATLLLFQRLRWKGLAFATIGSAALLVTVYVGSDVSRERIQETMDGLANYQDSGYTTSTTLRMSFLSNTLELVAEDPILGRGMGSFSAAYAEHIEGSPFPPTVNPHNEFLMLAVQSGLVGSALLALLLGLQLWYSRRLPQGERQLAQALAVTMGLGCMFNSFLMDTTEGHFFAFFSALLFARLSLTEAEENSQAAEV